MKDTKTPGQIRTAAHLSQRELADLVGLGLDTIRMYEANPLSVGSGRRELLVQAYLELSRTAHDRQRTFERIRALGERFAKEAHEAVASRDASGERRRRQRTG